MTPPHTHTASPRKVPQMFIAEASRGLPSAPRSLCPRPPQVPVKPAFSQAVSATYLHGTGWDGADTRMASWGSMLVQT